METASEISLLSAKHDAPRALRHTAWCKGLQKLSFIAIAGLLALTPTAVFPVRAAPSPDLVGEAGSTPEVEITMVAEVLRPDEGAPGRRASRFVPAEVLTQGEIVHYTVRIHNPTRAPVRDVVVVRRVPRNVTYLTGSASGPGATITFSVDGGRSFARPAALRVSEPSGVTRPATPADYTHIRWALRYPLAPGATALARFRAVFG